MMSPLGSTPRGNNSDDNWGENTENGETLKKKEEERKKQN
jgi:hypothetical protein